MGRATSVTDPEDAVYAYTYDPDGHVLTEQGPSGTMHLSYDTRGNPVSVTLPAGGTARYEYDAVGLLVTATEPGGAAWQTAYDRVGSAISSTDPLHAVTEQAWTAGGQLASVTDALGMRPADLPVQASKDSVPLVAHHQPPARTGPRGQAQHLRDNHRLRREPMSALQQQPAKPGTWPQPISFP